MLLDDVEKFQVDHSQWLRQSVIRTMSITWMVVILLGCRPSLQAESTCLCKNQVETDLIKASDQVKVPCPEPIECAEQITFSLFKDGMKISTNHCLCGKNGIQCEEQSHARISLQTSNRSVSYVLKGQTIVNQSVYGCEGEVMFPPPYKKLPSPLGIQILVKIPQTDCSTPQVGTPNSVWILVSMIALLFIYGAVITILAMRNRTKLRQTDLQSDYINTRPKVAKGHGRGF